MKSNLAVLALLVARPLGRASFEDIERDIEAGAGRDQGEQLPDEDALGDVDLFKAGLVTPDGDGLRVTEAGRSVLNALRELRQASPNVIGEKGSPDDQDFGAVRATSLDAPPSLLHGFGSAAEVGPEIRSRQRRAFAEVAAKFRQLGALWRKHLQYDRPERRMEHRDRNGVGAVIAVLSLLLLIICAGAAATLMQFRSMNSEIAHLQRELSSLKDRFTRIDQAERARQLEEKANAERTAKSGEDPPQEVPLNLSREEIQLIRDYIKPAPFAGPATAPITVGDPVTGATIPFPSPITDKVPKLLGARFAIRNGAIIIVRKSSGRADAVIGVN